MIIPTALFIRSIVKYRKAKMVMPITSIYLWVGFLVVIWFAYFNTVFTQLVRSREVGIYVLGFIFFYIYIWILGIIAIYWFFIGSMMQGFREAKERTIYEQTRPLSFSDFENYKDYKLHASQHPSQYEYKRWGQTNHFIWSPKKGATRFD
ncbi:MAG: hypothetical protein LBI63_05575 [Candidatus Ancillula sp.]|jgi:ABC-type lipoprotein release transport system permease subunit|nr:hypothetical protein [Candidatus Ancillula sp.]